MDFKRLPFDSDAMVAGLKPWIECESPTFDPAAVDRMMDLASYDLAAAGGDIVRIPGRMGFGGSVRARFPHKDFGKPGILIAGHLDTVHPIGTLEKNPWRIEGGRCFGPGIQDMKGGNYVSIEAIRQLRLAGFETPLPITVLFTPDEEVGTPSSRELIEMEARKNKIVLVPEPARSDGGAATGRYAIARFNVKTSGWPSHAGCALKDGRSAIAAMALKVLQIEAMTGEDCTFSVGVIHAGQWVNCVSSFCDAEVLSMVKRQIDLDEGLKRMLALGRRGERCGDPSRARRHPPCLGDECRHDVCFPTRAGHCRRDWVRADACQCRSGSDGNFTGALGIPTLDCIGLRGEGLHTLSEHIVIDSLVERTQLMAGLLTRLE
ncbi:M20/M25/M40 family metallo-hydrolase [Mesorhizobium sp. M0520]|uniref:M20/M25/M40 family metallo-hydrolase n=1 Tax=Mesorhizobium sp. M0520 TaxID=2956957 RepID=UPI00333DD4FC